LTDKELSYGSADKRIGTRAWWRAEGNQVQSLPYLVWASRQNKIYWSPSLDFVFGRSTSLQGKIFQNKLKPKVVQSLKDLRNRLEEQERKKKWPPNVDWCRNCIDLL
jgi:hypothetical protein